MWNGIAVLSAGGGEGRWVFRRWGGAVVLVVSGSWPGRHMQRGGIFYINSTVYIHP